MRTILLLLLSCCLSLRGATLSSDGSQSDTQTKINSAVDGDTVTLPSGSFSWGSGVTITGKGIRLTGGGAGRVIATSASSVAAGTGTKTFTTVTNGAPITAGQSLHVERTGGEPNTATGRP